MHFHIPTSFEESTLPKTYSSETKRCKCNDLPKSPPHRYGMDTKSEKLPRLWQLGVAPLPTPKGFFLEDRFMLDSMVSGLVLGVRVVVETLPGAPATTPFKPPNHLATFDQSLHGQDTQFLTACEKLMVKEIHPWPGGPSKRTHKKKKKHAPFSQIKSNFEWKKTCHQFYLEKKSLILSVKYYQDFNRACGGGWDVHLLPRSRFCFGNQLASFNLIWKI